MIGTAFAYFNYKFSEYKFIDFNEHIFYKQRDVFIPKSEDYIVILFSSNMTKKEDLLKNITAKYPIIAIDIFQKRFPDSEQVEFLTAPMNTLLQVIQKFNIYSVPSVFVITQQSKTLYKQDSQVDTLNTN